MGKLLLLPAQTAPADEALKRRHDPRSVETTYTVFRDCLRWEFGFTCAICLLHERDILAYGGAEGWAVMHIEHLVARSHDDGQLGIYANLLYICRLCNGARSDAPHEDDQGRRLLDPTKDIWSKHFRVENDQLVFHAGDRDAVYTDDVYGINDARKVKLRRARRERSNDFSDLITSHRTELARLTKRKDRAGILRTQTDLGRLYRRSTEGAAWVPEDKPESCRCGRAHARSLPAPYLRQVVEIEVPDKLPRGIVDAGTSASQLDSLDTRRRG